MKLRVALLGLLCLAASGSYRDDGWPPKAYQQDATATVQFASDVHPSCGKDPPGGILEACQKGRVLTLPNPCIDPAFAHQSYARLACHELGHLNGWPANHPR